MGIDVNSKARQIINLVEFVLLFGVPQIDHDTIRGETGSKLLYDFLDQYVLPTGGKFDHFAIR